MRTYRSSKLILLSCVLSGIGAIGCGKYAPSTLAQAETLQRATIHSAPETLIIEGPSSQTDDTFATFQFKSNQAKTTFECQLDAQGFKPCGGAHTVDGLGFGQHQFEVRAINEFGITDP